LVFEVELLDVKGGADPMQSDTSGQPAGNARPTGPIFDKEQAMELLTSPLFIGSTALVLVSFAIAFYAALSEDKNAKAKRDALKIQGKEGDDSKEGKEGDDSKKERKERDDSKKERKERDDSKKERKERDDSKKEKKKSKKTKKDE